MKDLERNKRIGYVGANRINRIIKYSQNKSETNKDKAVQNFVEIKAKRPDSVVRNFVRLEKSSGPHFSRSLRKSKFARYKYCTNPRRLVFSKYVLLPDSYLATLSS